MKVKLNIVRPTHKISFFLIFVAVAVVISLLAGPVTSISNNQCGSCHSNYNQQIDLFEGNSQNNFPTSLQVGQVSTVSVVLQNINNAPRYTQLSSVSITLRSQSNHFSVNSPTYTIGNMGVGTAIATWQITGTSAGSDQFVITASARNTHQNVAFSDSFSPNPSITVTATSTTPTSTPLSTPTPTANPTQNPTPTATAQPSSTPFSTPSPTASISNNPTTIPSATPTPSDTPTNSASPTASPNSPETTSPSPTPTETDNEEPTTAPTPEPTVITNQHNEELNSNMLYVHPPLAIGAYVFIFAFTIAVTKIGISNKSTKVFGITAWILTFLGLLTGMFWAQSAWGSYWSWDTKEILTLALFLSVSFGEIAYFEKNQRVTKWILTISCALTVITALSSFIMTGPHSFT